MERNFSAMLKLNDIASVALDTKRFYILSLNFSSFDAETLKTRSKISLQV